MTTRHGPAPDGDDAHRDLDVILEHWTTLRGRPLELRVTTVDATNHDSVLVRVRYGGGQAEVIAVAEDPASEAVELSEAMTSKAADKTTTMPAVKGDGQAVCSARNQPCHPTSSPEIFKATSAEDGTSSVLTMVFAGKVILPEEIFQHILSLLPWHDIVNIRRVSRSWRYAVDLHFAQRTELHIGRHDPPVVLDDNTFENLLRAMPALKHLSVEWREDGKKLDVDIVTRHCRQLVELDLARFRLDAWSLEQLCVACPKLEVVKLPRKSDDSCAEALLRNLPRLRSLDLTRTKVNGHFLSTCQESLERLSSTRYDFTISHGTLRGSDLLVLLTNSPQLERLSLPHASISSSSSLRQLNQVQTVLRLRELDVTSVNGLASTDLTAILSCSPQLERLWASELYDMDLATCLMQLSRCAELRDLDVSCQIYAEIWTEAGALTALLSGCRKLERLVLAGYHFTNSTSFRELAQCPELRDLDLRVRGRDYLGISRGQVTDAADLKQGLAGCPLLERLSVTELTAPLEQAVPPSGLLFLTYLSVEGYEVLTNNSLRRLPGLFPRLHTLIIRDCNSVSEDGLMSYLPRLQNLRSLELENVTGVTGALREKLKKRWLTRLIINGEECA